jgi:hypothetical protein
MNAVVWTLLHTACNSETATQDKCTHRNHCKMNYKYAATSLHVDTHHRFKTMRAHAEDHTVVMTVSPSKLLLLVEFPLSLIHHLHVEDEPVKCHWNKPQLSQEEVETYENSNTQIKLLKEITSSAIKILTPLYQISTNSVQMLKVLVQQCSVLTLLWLV